MRSDIDVEMRTVVVIPARGGSKGIPRKNIKLLNGTPLIAYTVTAASRVVGSDRVFVSTDDEAIASTARRLGVRVLRRSPELGRDRVTLDPVIHEAVGQITALSVEFELVATIQPTAPLLTADRIREGIRKVDEEDLDTVLTVVEDRHLRWRYDEGGDPIPMFSERLNRQQLPMELRETGGLLVTRRSVVTPDSRIGPRVGLLQLDPSEAVDIDSYAEWWVAENHLKHRRLAVRVDGGGPLGLGHVYRQLTLLDRLTNHEVVFFMDGRRDKAAGVTLARSRGVEVVEGSEEQLAAGIEEYDPQLVFVDRLDTLHREMQELKTDGRLLVSFEDMGEGSDVADLVFNALYADPRADDRRVFSGPEYVCLREEFHLMRPKTVGGDIEVILLTFGGTDPNNLTEKAALAVAESGLDARVNIVLGKGYDREAALEAALSRVGGSSRFTIIRDTQRISDYMLDADLAITSAGRTVFEVLACSTPCVVLSQNIRETSHTSTDIQYGVVNLGLGTRASVSEIAREVVRLRDPSIRMELVERTTKLDLMDGPERILFKVFAEYERRERQRLRRSIVRHSVGAKKN